MEQDLFTSLWERCEAARDCCAGLRRLYMLHLNRHHF
jgi:hypothetical protein